MLSSKLVSGFGMKDALALPFRLIDELVHLLQSLVFSGENFLHGLENFLHNVIVRSIRWTNAHNVLQLGHLGYSTLLSLMLASGFLGGILIFLMNDSQVNRGKPGRSLREKVAGQGLAVPCLGPSQDFLCLSPFSLDA